MAKTYGSSKDPEKQRNVSQAQPSGNRPGSISDREPNWHLVPGEYLKSGERGRYIRWIAENRSRPSFRRIAAQNQKDKEK